MLDKLLKRYKCLPLEVKASTAYTICSVLQKCLAFLTLPLFTRLLTTTQYGQYTIYASWSAILTIFITLNLPYGTFSTAMVKFKEKRKEYTSTLNAIFIFLAVIVLIIYLPFAKFWNNIFELPTSIVILMLVEIICTAATESWFAQNRFDYKYKGVVIVTLLKSLLAPLTALVLVMLMKEKGYARIIGYAVITIVVGSGIMIFSFRKGKTFFNKAFWKYAFGFNVPLIPYYISQMIFNTSDRIMISNFCGTDKAGIYGVAYSLAIVLNFVINAINNSYAPWFFKKIESGRGEDNRKVSSMLAAFVATGLFGIIAITPEFIFIMAGKDYMEAIWVVPPVAISTLLMFYTQLFDRILFYYEKKKRLVLGAVIPCIINLILNYLLIPQFGFVAAAYTTLASYVIFVMINFFTMQHTILEAGSNVNMYYFKALILIFIVFCGLSVIMMLLYENVVIRYILLFVIGLVVAAQKKRFINLLKTLKEK